MKTSEFKQDVEERKWYIKCPITGSYLHKQLEDRVVALDPDKPNFEWGTLASDGGIWGSKFTRDEIEAFTFEHAHLIEDEVTE